MWVRDTFSLDHYPGLCDNSSTVPGDSFDISILALFLFGASLSTFADALDPIESRRAMVFLAAISILPSSRVLFRLGSMTVGQRAGFGSRRWMLDLWGSNFYQIKVATAAACSITSGFWVRVCCVTYRADKDFV